MDIIFSFQRAYIARVRSLVFLVVRFYLLLEPCNIFGKLLVFTLKCTSDDDYEENEESDQVDNDEEVDYIQVFLVRDTQVDYVIEKSHFNFNSFINNKSVNKLISNLKVSLWRFVRWTGLQIGLDSQMCFLWFEFLCR